MTASEWCAQVAAACEPVLEALLADPDIPAPLRAPMRHSVLGGGKRLRPALCLATAVACGALEAIPRLLPAACALELLHTYSLIHDDLPAMDDAALRRGRPTCHRVFGVAAAILAGDALQALAFDALARPVPGVPAARGLAAVRALASAAGPVGMCGGQALDLDAQRAAPDDAGLWRLQALKTGALIGAAVQIGAHLAGASATALARLGEYGREVGRAFQIADDVLDVTGAGSALGKVPGADAAASKATVVTRFGVAEASRLAAAAAEAAVAALGDFGAAAETLRALARFSANRER